MLNSGIKYSKLFYIIVILFLIPGCKNGTGKLLYKASEINSALLKSSPGDTILLADGTYSDVSIIFNAHGTQENPIVFCPKNNGKVIFAGNSSIKIGGEYLVIKGFIFKNGFSSDNPVIEFRSDSESPALNCRLTQCVIDGFNIPDRSKTDIWVALFGKNNRVDHNFFTGKLSNGVTLAVLRDDSVSINNYHKIDNNYFGKRQRLGSNGGETIRVGTSKNSLLPSNTLIEDNYFYQCDGEVEIISIKSCENTIRRNTFIECEGSLVLRHGNNNTVESNIFIGNGKPNTGGVRVINSGHKIYNNLFVGLKGERFRSAFALMNGVPNSLINRYHQVKNVFIGFNSFINCERIGFGVGKDNERTAVANNTSFVGNLIADQQTKASIEFLDDISGISFSSNYIVSQSEKSNQEGFTTIPSGTKEINQIPYPAEELPAINSKEYEFITGDLTGKPRPEFFTIGAIQSGNLLPLFVKTLEQVTEISWYENDNSKIENNRVGKCWQVDKSENSISEALKNSKAGDIIELTDTGTFVLEEPIVIAKSLTFRSAKTLTEKPVLKYSGKNSGFSFFVLVNGGSLILERLNIDGESPGEYDAENAVIVKSPMVEHYKLRINNCGFSNFTEANFSVLKTEKNTFADSIIFHSCLFREMSCDALSLSSEKDDNGRYNTEYLIIRNCIFHKIMGNAINLYRGGNDESTLGPYLQIDHCVFNEVNNREGGSVLRLIGVQNASINSSIFSESGKGGFIAKFEEMRWDNCKIENCNIYNSGKIGSNSGSIKEFNIQHFNPGFANPEKLNFKLLSPAFEKMKASDGGKIGCEKENITQINTY
jgi:poly(beta-D-mannuronate) lyase